MSVTSRKNKKNANKKQKQFDVSCAGIAAEKANILKEAFNKVGIDTHTSNYCPCWCDEDFKYQGPVTEIELYGIYDNEGYPYSFMFRHDNGEIL